MSGKYEFDPDAQYQFSPAERDHLRERIAQYFCDRIEADPAVLEVGSITGLLGRWQEVNERKLSVNHHLNLIYTHLNYHTFIC